MNIKSYFPDYFSMEDLFVTQEKVQCTVKIKLTKMGFLDPSSEGEDLEPGRIVNLPLWYVKELKPDNPYFSFEIPDIYKNVHKAVCEADTTHIELGKLHPYFYEYGRHLAAYDRNHFVGQVVFETCRQRIRHLLDNSKNTIEDVKSEDSRDNIENQLYNIGVKTNTLYVDWLQMRKTNIKTSTLVEEHSKKRKRSILNDEDLGPPNKKK